MRAEYGWERTAAALPIAASGAANSGIWSRWLAGVGELPNYIDVIPIPPKPSTQRRLLAEAKRRERATRPREPSLRDRAVALARAQGEVTSLELQTVGVHRCYH